MIPDPETQNILQSEIDRLSARHNTPVFSPHITVGKLPDHAVANAGEFLQKITSVIKHREIYFGNIVTGNAPYQKLTIEVKPSPLFTELITAINKLFGDASSNDEFHASLMYGQAPTQILNQETKSSAIKSLQKSVACKLAVVDLSGVPKEWTPIATEEFKSLVN